MINYFKKLLGIFPDDWEFIETINAYWKGDTSGIKINVYYNVYFSSSRCKYKIDCYGYNAEEHSMYLFLKSNYDAQEIRLKKYLMNIKQDTIYEI
jgi:hypothetical protein